MVAGFKYLRVVSVAEGYANSLYSPGDIIPREHIEFITIRNYNSRYLSEVDPICLVHNNTLDTQRSPGAILEPKDTILCAGNTIGMSKDKPIVKRISRSRSNEDITIVSGYFVFEYLDENMNVMKEKVNSYEL